MMHHFCFIIQGFLLKENGDNIVGPHVQAYLKAKALLKRSFKVSYICLTDDLNYNEKTETKDGIDVYYVARKTRPFRIEELLSIKEISNLLYKLKPDIVYTRGRTSLPWISSRYCIMNNKISIWNAARDRDFLRYTYLKEKSNDSLLKFLISFPFYYLIMIYLFESGIKKSNLIIVQNEFQKNNTKYVFHLSNFVLLPQLAPEKTSHIKKDNNKIKVIWIGGLKKEKAPEKFMEIVDELKDKSIEFNMVGKILDINYKYIESFNHPNFRYYNSLDYFKTLDIMKESHILINTSNTGNEGFPNTFVQAWRYGLKVITLGINPDNLLNSYLGYSCKTVSEAVDKISYITDNKNFDSDSEKIEEYVENNHSDSYFIDIVNNLFESNKFDR